MEGEMEMTESDLLYVLPIFTDLLLVMSATCSLDLK
jgi:hypothetical protein